MRIAHVVPTLGTGGAERILVDVATGQVQAGWEVTIHTLNGQTHFADSLRTAGVHVVDHRHRQGEARGAASAAMALLRALRRERASTLVGWLYHGSLAVALAGRGAARSFSSIHHDSPNAGLKKSTRSVFRVLTVLSRRFDGAIYVTEKSAQEHRRAGFNPHATVIPVGVAVESAPASSESRAAARAALGIGEDSVVFAHLARVHPDKAQVDLIRALDLTEQGIVVVAAGAGWAKGITVVDSWISGMRHPERLILLGEIDGPSTLFDVADAFVLSSRTEALPVSLLEAMAAGLLPVVTDVGGCSDAVGDVGEVVSPGDVSGLAAAMNRAAMSCSAERSDRLRRRVMEKYSVDAMRQRYDALLLGGGVGGSRR